MNHPSNPEFDPTESELAAAVDEVFAEPRDGYDPNPRPIMPSVERRFRPLPGYKIMPPGHHVNQGDFPEPEQEAQ